MANENSAYLADFIRDEVLSRNDLTVKLYTDTVTQNGSGDEVSGGSYAPQSATFVTDGTGAIRNQDDIEFDDMPNVTVRSAALWDGGNMICGGKLVSSKEVRSGDPVKFVAGELKMSWLAG